MYQRLVPVSGVIRGRHDDPLHADLVRKPVDTFGHVYVHSLVLIGKLGSNGHWAGWLVIAKVNDGVASGKQWPKRMVADRLKVQNMYIRNARSVAAGTTSIGEDHVVACLQGRQQLGSDVPRGTGQEHAQASGGRVGQASRCSGRCRPRLLTGRADDLGR